MYAPTTPGDEPPVDHDGRGALLIPGQEELPFGADVEEHYAVRYFQGGVERILDELLDEMFGPGRRPRRRRVRARKRGC